MRSPAIYILFMPTFKAGDPAPSGYLEWHEWAAVQHKAGLRQKQCGRCLLWKFPQELSDLTDTTNARTSRGKKTCIVDSVCTKCAEAK